MAEQSNDGAAKVRGTKVSQTEFPNHSVHQALRIAQALWDHFAGKGAAPHQIAMAIDMSPTSGTWRNLCGSSIAFGLTEGGYNAQQITLTDLGRRIVAPLEEGDDVRAKVEAILKPRVLREFFQRYDKAKFPKDDIAKNVLVAFGLPKDRTDKAFDILKDAGMFAGVLHDTKSGLFVALDTPAFGSPKPIGPLSPSDEADSDADEEDDSPSPSTRAAPAAPAPAKTPAGPRQIFVAHGKNMKPVDDLRKILDQFKIPYRIAVDEPHSGRPISAKVAELMKSCSAGIFIFTKDEQFTNAKGQEIWRPSENAIYELGAGNILWDSKIIVLKEEGVNFASDYQDIGYINFDTGGVSAKALDLLKELVALELVQFQAV